MDQLTKKIWKKVLGYQVAVWIFIIPILLFFYFRSGSLTAVLTIGLGLLLGSFRFTYSVHQNSKRQILEEEAEIKEEK